jgi:hypothetical protein
MLAFKTLRVLDASLGVRIQVRECLLDYPGLGFVLPKAAESQKETLVTGAVTDFPSSIQSLTK